MTDPHAYTTIKVPKSWHIVGRATLFMCFAATAVYALAQLASGIEVRWVLAGVAVVNTALVYVFGTIIVRDLAEMLERFPQLADPPDPLDARISDIMNDAPRSYLFALGYAIFLAACSFSIAPDPETGLRPYFVAFIFFASLKIGYALWAVIRFWTLVLTGLERVPFRLLNLSAAPLPALMRFNSRVVALTAWVSTSAVGALALSGYTADQPIILFSLFAFALVAATYVVPVVPISNRLRRLQAHELNVIEAQIADYVARLGPTTDDTASTAQTPVDKDADDALARALKARDLITSVRTLPPGGQVSVSAAAIATILPFLPSVIDWAIKFLEQPTPGG